MKTNGRILAAAAIATLLGATAFTSTESRASVPSSPAEREATAELNRDVMRRNAAADEQHRLLDVQYQEQQKQYEAQQRLYEAQNKSQDNRGR